MKETLPFMSEELQEFATKFPEAGEAIRKFVKEIAATKKFDVIMSDFSYKPGNKFPRSITIKHIGKKTGVKTPQKFVQGLTCSWKGD